MRRALLLLALLPLVGAGCAFPWANSSRVAIAEPLCLSWSTAEGFAAWIQAYADGNAEAAALAGRIHLPKQAHEKLIMDLSRSLETNAQPSFLCALDAVGRNVAWVMESSDGDTCVDTFYVSIAGEGTTSEFMTTGHDCSQLCKPKRLEENLLVWQCDLRKPEAQASWTQLHMNRWTGVVETLGCQEDALGLPSGCVR